MATQNRYRNHSDHPKPDKTLRALQHIRYKGYEVAPVAQRLPNGLFAANLTIEKTSATNGAHAYSFDALDYFFDEEHALAYAFRWGRLWIDSHQ